MSGYDDYEPLQPQRRDWRETLKRALGPLVAVALGLAKFSFILVKFGSIFVTIGLYGLAFGWTYGIGFVLLILFHELGHYLEAKREGLDPKLPVFVPFLGAYVQYTRGHPWQTVKVAIAGPILGGLAALACYVAGKARGSDLLLALAHIGFLLNLINLIPVWILDGGAIWRSARWLRLGGGRGKAMIAYALLFGTAALLVVGMFASHVPRSRV
jgi:Zn-dependent protease